MRNITVLPRSRASGQAIAWAGTSSTTVRFVDTNVLLYARATKAALDLVRARRSAPTLALLAVSSLLAAGCSPPGSRAFSARPYLEDLALLEAVTATTYANLEWAITEGGVDPAALHERTVAALEAAASDEEARRALVDFVDHFGDGHFRLRPARPEGTSADEGAEAPGPETPATEACARLGYEEHDQSFRFDLGERFQATTAADDPFPAGWLELEDGRRIGLVRIDEFGANRFGEYCPESWEAFRLSLEAPCDDWECEHAFELTLVERLLTEISDRVALLRAHGIGGLAVDVTANGGGGDWTDPAARLLTAKTLVGNERSVVRHPHWEAILEEMAADVASDLSRPGLSPDQAALLAEVSGRLEGGIARAAEPCNLSSIWQRGGGEPPCTLLVRGTLYTTGLLSSPPNVAVDGFATGRSLLHALDYREREAVWTGPLALLVDRYTASASEYFAALLRDNEAAVLVGETTFGVGCGYTNGGIQTQLPASGLELWMPDCVRHRRDGGNERAGLEPDLAAAWASDDPRDVRGAKLLDRLEAWADSLPAPPAAPAR